MEENNTLTEAFIQTTYKLGGHGRRDIQTLKEAFKDIDGQEVSDNYGHGEIIEDFQDKMAAYLGKEAAVFFPSGTMAQQIALRICVIKKG